MECKTIRDALYWSYANTAMAHHALTNGLSSYVRASFMVRSRLFKGLSSGKMNIASLYDDEKARLKAERMCVYCGCPDGLSLDHLVPRKRGGSDSGDNLVYACRSCNSSKGDTDLLRWCTAREVFPPLLVLRRYLKLLAGYCEACGLLDAEFATAGGLDTPFEIALLPLDFPGPGQIHF